MLLVALRGPSARRRALPPAREEDARVVVAPASCAVELVEGHWRRVGRLGGAEAAGRQLVLEGLTRGGNGAGAEAAKEGLLDVNLAESRCWRARPGLHWPVVVNGVRWAKEGEGLFARPPLTGSGSKLL